MFGDKPVRGCRDLELFREQFHRINVETLQWRWADFLFSARRPSRAAPGGAGRDQISNGESGPS